MVQFLPLRPWTADMTDPLWTRVEPISSGVHRATLINIEPTLGAASGKPVFVWTFQLDSGQRVSLYTSKRGEGARKGYECAKALGLSRRFTHSEAVGRLCRIELDSSGQWMDITRVLPA